MAGHSHWAGIKHKKAAADAKRGKVWSKLSKAIIVAARSGGGDAATNLRLRYAIDDAKALSMPRDNIQRAIKKGTGEIEGGHLDQVVYEGYGPGGVAVLCKILTDNRNRTASEIRKIFELAGGKLGSSGCVAWMFENKGLVLVPQRQTDEDTLMELALEHGAEDVRLQGDSFEVTCPPEAYDDVLGGIKAAGLTPEVNELALIPQSTVNLSEGDARKVLRLIDRLDDHDDVQEVASNFNIPDEVLEKVEAGG